MRVVSPSILPQYEPFFWSISPFRKKRAHDFIPPFQERKTSEMIKMCSRFHLSCLFTEEAIDEIVNHWNREPQKYLGFDFFLLIFLKKWIFFEFFSKKIHFFKKIDKKKSNHSVKKMTILLARGCQKKRKVFSSYFVLNARCWKEFLIPLGKITYFLLITKNAEIFILKKRKMQVKIGWIVWGLF